MDLEKCQCNLNLFEVMDRSSVILDSWESAVMGNNATVESATLLRLGTEISAKLMAFYQAAGKAFSDTCTNHGED